MVLCLWWSGGGGGGLVLRGGAGIVGMTLFHCSVSLVFVCSGGIDVHRGCFLWLFSDGLCSLCWLGVGIVVLTVL